jgi:hypothetical protein
MQVAQLDEAARLRIYAAKVRSLRAVPPICPGKSVGDFLSNAVCKKYFCFRHKQITSYPFLSRPIEGRLANRHGT